MNIAIADAVRSTAAGYENCLRKRKNRLLKNDWDFTDICRVQCFMMMQRLRHSEI